VDGGTIGSALRLPPPFATVARIGSSSKSRVTGSLAEKPPRLPLEIVVKGR
jgi:hypothetical protein